MLNLYAKVTNCGEAGKDKLERINLLALNVMLSVVEALYSPFDSAQGDI